MHRPILLVMIAAALPYWPSLEAQVPQFVNYTGGVALGGTNYNGYGYFKFAFINHDASQTYWSNDGTSDGGGEPQTALRLAVGNGAYDVLLGDTNLANMTPVPPTVFTNAQVFLRVWFSDGTVAFQPILPDQPVAAVGYAMTAANVADGAVTAAKLGPNAVTGASIAPGSVGPSQLAPGAAAANLRGSGGLILSDQANATNLVSAGFQKIGTVQTDSDQWSAFTTSIPSPRYGHSAVWTGREMIIWGGYDATRSLLKTGGRYDPATDSWRAMSRTNAPSGRANHQAFVIGNRMLVVGGISSFPGGLYDFTSDSWQLISMQNAPTTWLNKVLVWTGQDVLVWGAEGVGWRYNPSQDLWRTIASSNIAPTLSLSGVWSGNEMLVWGRNGGISAGARYNPFTDTWAPMNQNNQPSLRTGQSAVWTGRQMIVWGGEDLPTGQLLSDGSRYDPVRDAWTPVPMTSAPTPRRAQAAMWTGNEMLIWGGIGRAANGVLAVLGDGGRYNPATGVWTPVGTNASLPALPGSSALWTGQDLIVWGGGGQGPQRTEVPPSNDGEAWRLAANQWRPVAASPVGRTGHTLVWTGTELIVWGGVDRTSTLVNSGFRFNPGANGWTRISSLNAPTARGNHQAVWTGKEMLVWGGSGRGGQTPYLNTGARYNPATDTWVPISTNGAPAPRTSFTMVWSGRQAVIFGGLAYVSREPSQPDNSGALYQPDTDSWISMNTVQAPSPRSGHLAVWTGREMIVWGGSGNSFRGPGTLITGAKYDPQSNQWTPMSTNNAPVVTERTGPTPAVWSGREMLVWIGGFGVGASRGGRYDPVSDRWRSMSTAAAPSALATSVVSVWTGREMIIWGSLEIGARYDPLADAWTPMTRTGAPVTRAEAAAAWTGDAMFIFGGVPDSGPVSDDLLRYTPTRSFCLYGHP